MSQKIEAITPSTFIPIGAVIVVFGAAAWLTSVYRQGEVNANEITQLKQDNEKSLDKIEEKLERIDQKVDRLLEKSKLR